MTTFLFFYACVLLGCFIAASIADAIFRFSNHHERFSSRCFYAVGVFVVLLMVVHQFHQQDSLLKVENHGVVWVKDLEAESKIGLGDEAVMIMTADKKIFILNSTDVQHYHFNDDTVAGDRVVFKEHVVRVF